MAHKNHYKKIFVIGAALFVLFAPVGAAIGVNLALAQTTAGTLGSNSTGPTLQTETAPIDTTIATQQIQTLDTTAASTAATTAAPVTGLNNAAANAAGTTSVNPSFYACATNVATCGVYYVSLVVNSVMTLFLIIGAWLVKLGLQFNNNIFNAPAVQTGFSVSLAIANLGFVLGIIIIAIATILRNQTYGIKQLLWKLVMMAILVNFGLVITAPIVGFANSMSNYFINASSPSTATGGYAAYVETMMTAFAPQKLNVGAAASKSTFCNSIASYDPLINTVCNLAGQSTTSPPSSSDSLWQNTMALMFDIAFEGIAAFVFLCLAVLLIIRYLTIAGLLIVLPLAWLTYVFPKFDNSFSKWWNTFIKWTFFPPLALFFIYLAFITATSTNNTGVSGTATNQYVGVTTGGTGTDATIETTITKITGISGDVVAQSADEILLVGLMIMGLMFANSLSGKAGKATVGAAAGASKAFGTWAGKSGRRAGYRAAAWAAKPRPRIDPATGNLYSPITGPRADAARWLRQQAQRQDLKTQGLASSVWQGAKKGSGIFKDKSGAKDWSCQKCGHINRSTKKPTISCPQCGSTAAVANWTVVS